MQQQRSLVHNEQPAPQAEMEGASQLPLLILLMILGLQLQRHQPVVDGDLHLQPTNLHFKKLIWGKSVTKPFLPTY
jgi:hypothetical protein